MLSLRGSGLIHGGAWSTILERVGSIGQSAARAREGFRMPKRYRVVGLTIWPGLAQIWSGQEALGLFWGFALRRL